MRVTTSCLLITVLCSAELLRAETRHPNSPSPAPIADSAEQQQWKSVQRLLAAGADVASPQADGMTALHWAALHSHEPALKQLLQASADPNAATRYGVTPLSIACRAGNVGLLSELLSAGGNANTALPGGETLLMIAASTGCVPAVEALLAAGAKVGATERRGQTALMWAAAEGHAEVIQVLLAAGADRDRTLKSGFNALRFAAREGKLLAVETLIAAGADVGGTMRDPKGGGRKPRKGTSALLLAVESGHFELALRLVELGADPNDLRSGFTPLHALTWVRKTKRGDSPAGDPPPRGSGNVTSLRFARRLVAVGADVNARLQRGKKGVARLTHAGATPFLMAAKNADLPLMQLLVELGADPRATNVDGTNALMAAAGIGVVAVGEEPGTEPEVLAATAYLLDLGLDINHKDENGETAMHGAAYRNYPQVVEFLAARGADPQVWNAKNDYGWTPTMIAHGKRPGSLKPSPKTIAALAAALASSGHTGAD